MLSLTIEEVKFIFETLKHKEVSLQTRLLGKMYFFEYEKEKMENDLNIIISLYTKLQNFITSSEQTDSHILL